MFCIAKTTRCCPTRALGVWNLALYECAFCSDRLKPDRPRWYQYPLLLILIRPYFCPHCGDGALRPITSLRNLFSSGDRNHGRSSVSTDWSGDSTASAGKASSSRKSRRTSSSGGGSSRPSSSSPSSRESHSSDESNHSDEERHSSRRTQSGSSRRSSSDRGSERNRSSSRSRRSSSSKAKQRSTQLAGITGDDAPNSYGRPNIVFRWFRRGWRRLRRMMGKKSSSRKSRKRRSSRSSSKGRGSY